MTEVASAQKSDSARVAVVREGERLLAHVAASDRVVALDERGQSWSTRKLAEQLEGWRSDGRDVALLIGGPDGLSDGCLERAEQRWSLSALTFPHMLVRVLVAEQMYRAHSLLTNHPYHRD